LVNQTGGKTFEVGGGREKHGLILNPLTWFFSQPEVVNAVRKIRSGTSATH
jgi:hypothetical protein